MANKKIVTSGIAVALAGVMLFGGTMAWQSISQTALNEVSAVVNPGGRLHDDFNNITTDETETMTFDKNVYVENFTSLAENGVQVFARVRLDEYMEFGKGAGTLDAEDSTKKAEGNEAVPLVAGTTLEDKSTWRHHIVGETVEDNPIRKYWTMDDDGGKATYMPTFNKNKDSLEADINGTSDDDFETYVDYSLEENAQKTANAIYDKDAEPEGEKEVDEIVKHQLTAKDIIEDASKADRIPNWSNYIKVTPETHEATETIEGEAAITMEQWLELDDEDKVGSFWVYDEDGWAYWASPINPDTATGLLLDGIVRTTEIINQDWYYGINVVAQFVTGDDLGQKDETGFYDITEGSAPTANALILLNEIGVDVEFKVDDAEGIAEAFANGGTVTLNDDITLTDALTVDKDVVLNLNGHTLSNSDDLWNEADKTWGVINVSGRGTTLIINGEEGGIIAKEDDCFCIGVKDGARVVVNGGTYKGNISAVYVKEGEAAIYGGDYSIQQLSSNPEPYNEVLNCYDENYANGTARMIVCGGTFHNFNPATVIESVDRGGYVASGYSARETSTGVFTVSKTVAASELTESD